MLGRRRTWDVDPGETIVCTYENKGRDSQFIKDAIPDDPADFTYSTSGLGANFDLDDDGDEANTLKRDKTITVSGTGFGAKSVTELVPTGWSLTNLTCTGDTEFVRAGATANLDVDPGETIVCTYENKQDATVKIIKDAIPDDPADFTYSTSGLGANFDLDDDGDEANTLKRDKTITVSGTGFGAKSVTELVPTGWSLTNLTCTGDTEFVRAGATANLDVDPGETIVCTYENKQDTSITIVKNAIPDDEQDFGYTTTGLFVTAFDLDDDGDNTNTLLNEKVITVSGADAGEKTVAEDEVAGWTLSDIHCTGDDNSSTDEDTRTATLDVDPGEQILCTFTNVKDAKVTIIKDAVPDAAQDFSFLTEGVGLSPFTLDDDATNALSNEQEFTISYNDFGAKSVTEEGVFGWDLTDITCSDTQGETSSGVLADRKAALQRGSG